MILAYAVLGVVLVALLSLDLFVLRRHATMRSAAIATAAWTTLGLLAVVPVALAHGGGATDYLTIYLLERALSIDNVALFAIVLATLRVPHEQRERAVVAGVAVALVLRVLLIGGGLALVDALHAVLYVFGALLLVTGLKTMRSGLPEADDAAQHGGLIVRIAGRLRGRSSAFVPLLALGIADVVFAVDSVPAAFGVTRDAFPIVAANGFAVLGLHAAYVLLEGGLARFRHLGTGLGVVLVLIGLELVLADVVHLPAWATLLAVVVVLSTSVLASLRPAGGPPAVPPRDDPAPGTRRTHVDPSERAVVSTTGSAE